MPILPHLSGMGGSIYRSELGVIAGKHLEIIFKGLLVLNEVQKFKATPCEGSDFGHGYYSAFKDLKEIADGNK